MTTYKEFEVLRTLLKAEGPVEDIPAYILAHKPYYAFKSPEELQTLVERLEQKGYIRDGAATEIALREIEPLRVDNAVILAAGGSDISAKSVYSMPKGLYVKNGETLIERADPPAPRGGHSGHHRGGGLQAGDVFLPGG